MGHHATLGYFLSGIQPFQLEPRRVGCYRLAAWSILMGGGGSRLMSGGRDAITALAETACFLTPPLPGQLQDAAPPHAAARGRRRWACGCLVPNGAACAR